MFGAQSYKEQIGMGITAASFSPQQRSEKNMAHNLKLLRQIPRTLQTPIKNAYFSNDVLVLLALFPSTGRPL
jgi:hypothetical protein